MLAATSLAAAARHMQQTAAAAKPAIGALGRGTRCSPLVLAHASAGFSSNASDVASQLAGASILSAGQLSRPQIDHIVDTATRIHAAPRGSPELAQVLQNKVVATMFFEPSTRTSCSFRAAAYRLGASVLDISGETSSAKKGETMEDTVRTVQQYADALVIRHPDADAIKRAAGVAVVPVLNAGSGSEEHPTQALLDLVTMMHELKTSSLDNMTVTLVGDLKFGRTVHSLVQLLAHFQNVTVNMVAPAALQMPQHTMQAVAGRLNVQQMEEYHSVLPQSDILYITRIQKERFTDVADYNALKGVYVLQAKDLVAAPTHMAVMHPLPRVDEIASDVDADPRAAYWRQVACGMSTRMALLALTLGQPIPAL